MDDPILSPFGESAEDDPNASKEENSKSLRIYYQNLNGLKMCSGDSFLNQAVGFLVDFNAGVTCLTKTNVNWAHQDAYSKVDRRFCQAYG